MRVFFYFKMLTLTMFLPFEKAAVFRNMYFVFFGLVKLTLPFKYSNDYLQWRLSVKNLSINSTCAYQYVVAEQKMKRDCMNNLENWHTEGEH